MTSSIEILVWMLSIAALAGFLRALVLCASSRHRVAVAATVASKEACAVLTEWGKRKIDPKERLSRLDHLRKTWEGAHELGPVFATAAGPCPDAIGFEVDRFVRRFDGGTSALCLFSMRSATMLGLAGTCLGMIQALSSQPGGAPSAATAMPGISTSLWATVIGIGIASTSWLAVKLLLEPSLHSVREAVEEAAWRVHEKTLRLISCLGRDDQIDFTRSVEGRPEIPWRIRPPQPPTLTPTTDVRPATVTPAVVPVSQVAVPVVGHEQSSAIAASRIGG